MPEWTDGPSRKAWPAWACPCELTFENVRRGGFRATYAKVIAPEEHVHRHWHHIEAMIDKSILSAPPEGPGQADLPQARRGRGQRPRRRPRQDPLPRGGRGRLDRRHRRLGNRPGPARRRPLRGQPRADRPRMGQGGARADAAAGAGDGRAAARRSTRRVVRSKAR